MNPVDNIALLSRYLEHQYGGGMLFIFWLICTFLFFAVLFLVMTMLSRIAKDADLRFENDLKALFEPFLLELLYIENIDTERIDIPETIAKKLETRFQKQIFTDVLVRLNKGLDGDLSRRLRSLYRLLKLDVFSQSKLKSHVWHIQAAGIDELREMRVVECVSFIEKLLNHPHGLVRSNAQLAVLELGNPEDRLAMFALINQPLTDWEQLRLHESMKNRSEHRMSSFGALFSVPNLSVVVFGIRMSAFFGCTNDIPALQRLSTDSREVVRLEAIRGLMYLGDFQMQNSLAAQFAQESLSVQKEILHYLMQTGFDKSSFYRAALMHPSHEVALLAAKGLARIDHVAFAQVAQEFHTVDEAKAAILAHAADRRLQRT